MTRMNLRITMFASGAATELRNGLGCPASCGGVNRKSQIVNLWLFAIALLCAPILSNAQSNITATLTVTNVAGITNGNCITNGGLAFLVTNSAFSLRYIAPTNTARKGATNIYNKLSAALTNLYASITWGTPTSIVFRTFTGGTNALSINTGWGTLSLATNATVGGISASNITAKSITLNGSNITSWSQIGGSGGGGTNYTINNTNNQLAGVVSTNGNVVTIGTSNNAAALDVVLYAQTLTDNAGQSNALLAAQATSAAVTLASANTNLATNIATLLTITPTNANTGVFDTNAYYTYGSDTNTLSVIQVPSSSGFAVFSQSNYLFNLVGYTNNAAGNQRGALVATNYPSSGSWALQKYGPGGTWMATNTVAGRLYGEYRTNSTGGDFWIVTPLRTLVTNLAAATINRGPVVYVDDWGARGDATALYGASVTNSAVLAPGASVTTNDVGKLFCLYLDSTNIASVLTTIVSVQSPTNFTLGPEVESYSLTNLFCRYGTENQPAFSNALWLSSLAVVPGGTLKIGYGGYLFGRSFLTDRLTNAAVLNLPEPLLNRISANNSYQPTNPAAAIWIEGSGGPPVLFSQYIKNDTDTVGKQQTGTRLYNVARAVLPGATAFIRHQPRAANDNAASGLGVRAYDDFGWNRYGFRNFTVLQQVLPKMDALDLQWAGTPYFYSQAPLVVDVDAPPNFYDVDRAAPKVFPSNITPFYFTRDQTNNITNSVNITNVTGLAVGVRLPRAYNYAGSRGGLAVYNHGIGLWTSEHAELDCQFGENTIGIFVESTEFYEGAGRGSISGPVLYHPFLFQNAFPIVVSTNGTRHYLTLYSPNFENAVLNFSTLTITDPAKKLSGEAFAVSGVDTFVTDATNFALGDIRQNLQDFGGRRGTNAASVAATLAMTIGSTNVLDRIETKAPTNAPSLYNANHYGTLTLNTNTSSVSPGTALNANGGYLTNVGRLYLADVALTRIAYGDNQGRLQAASSGFTSAAALASVSDETGTGLWVFNASPVFTGTPTAQSLTVSNTIVVTNGITTLGTNTLTFTAVSSCTNTLPQGDGTANITAGTGITLQDRFGNSVVPVLLGTPVPMRANMRLSGTAISCVIY